MGDITIAWNPVLGYGDWTMFGADLLSGNDLATAVLVSICTDRLASSDFTPPPPGNTRDRRGWWGDTYSTSQIGSRLWQLERAIKSNSGLLLALAQDYTAEALQWLLDDGVVGSLNIVAQWQNLTFLALSITATMPNGTTQSFFFSWVWNQPATPQLAIYYA